jgi:hypothetical protein
MDNGLWLLFPFCLAGEEMEPYHYVQINLG